MFESYLKENLNINSLNLDIKTGADILKTGKYYLGDTLIVSFDFSNKPFTLSDLANLTVILNQEATFIVKSLNNDNSSFIYNHTINENKLYLIVDADTCSCFRKTSDSKSLLTVEVKTNSLNDICTTYDLGTVFVDLPKNKIYDTYVNIPEETIYE